MKPVYFTKTQFWTFTICWTSWQPPWKVPIQL